MRWSEGSLTNAATEAARPPAIDLSRGTNQTGVRIYNERLVLSLIRRHRSLPRAEIARLTGLSPQTITVIMRSLETDGLVVKLDRQRGKIGQPSVPFALDPDGAFSFGLKIGRRSNDLVLMDFTGGVRAALHEADRYPTPAGVLDFVARATRELTERIGPPADRIAGIGVAAPFELWSWEEQIGAPREILDQWRNFAIQEEIARLCPWPVFFCNDATAACGAELVLGRGAQHQDFLYFFIGSFIGGGVVLNGTLYPGRTGNAGALGSMPIASAAAGGGVAFGQLIRSASIYVLEHKLAAAGKDASILWRSPDDWGELGPLLDQWIDEVAGSLAFAILAAASVIDFPAVVIDGAFPAEVRARIVAEARAKAALLDHRGLSPVAIVEGSVGSGARAIGGACLPLLANFARDREVLFKDTV